MKTYHLTYQALGMTIEFETDQLFLLAQRIEELQFNSHVDVTTVVISTTIL